jgi:hypothetical protein
VKDSVPQGGRRNDPVGTVEKQMKFERIGIDENTGTSMTDISITGLNILDNYYGQGKAFRDGQASIRRTKNTIVDPSPPAESS